MSIRYIYVAFPVLHLSQFLSRQSRRQWEKKEKGTKLGDKKSFGSNHNQARSFGTLEHLIHFHRSFFNRYYKSLLPPNKNIVDLVFIIMIIFHA